MRIEVTNIDTGIAAAVYDHARGFSVSLKDMDSGEYLPTVRIFEEYDAACAYARSLVIN